MFDAWEFGTIVSKPLLETPKLTHLDIDNNGNLQEIHLYDPNELTKLKHLDLHNNKRLEKICWKTDNGGCEETPDAVGTEVQDGGTAD